MAVIKIDFPDYTSRITEHVKRNKRKYVIGSYVALAAVVYYVVKDIPADTNENNVSVNLYIVPPEA
jgi:hypothetical protein